MASDPSGPPDCPSPLEIPITNPGVTHASQPPATGRRFPSPPPWSWSHSPEQLPELRETFHSLDLRFITKGSNSGAARQKRLTEQRLGEGNRGCHALSGQAPRPTSAHVHQPEAV